MAAGRRADAAPLPGQMWWNGREMWRRGGPHDPRRVTGDRGATQLAALAIVAAVGLGGGVVGYGAQQALDDDSAPQPVVLEAGEARGAIVAFDCPGGEAVGELQGGDRVYLTGVHAEEEGWVRTRNPLTTDEVWWITDEQLEPDADLDQLDEVGCGDPSELPADDGTDEIAAAETTTTAPPDQPPGTVIVETPEGPQSVVVQPDRPRPGTGENTSPTPAPDTSGPTLSVSIATGDPTWPDEIYETFPATCAGRPKEATLTVNVSDPSGVSQVRATWTVGNAAENRFLGGGSTRTTVIGPYDYLTVPANQQQLVTVTVTATDTQGNSSVRTDGFTLHSVDQCVG